MSEQNKPSRNKRKCLAQRSALGGLVLCALLGGCDGRPRTEAGKKSGPKTGPYIGVLDLSTGVPEQGASSLFGVGPKKRSFDRLVEAIAELKKDGEVRGAFVKFGSSNLGIARAQETGELLAGLREKKPVYCHAEGFSNPTLMAAARGCSKIYVAPAGSVDAIGIAAQVVYFRKLLVDELRLSIDFLQVGKFKGAEEPFTRDGPSDEARASLESVLVDMRAAWLDGITKGRDKAAAAAEDGPFSPPRAKEKNLIDEVGYADETLAAVRTAAGVSRDEVRFGPGADEDKSDELGEFLSLFTGEETAPIALIRATGSIAMSAGRGVFSSRGGITERELNRKLARVEKDDDIKAVVLRIDSPGGSALASDLIWHQLMKVRAKKPLVISVGDMAASGGYYLACTGSHIFAENTSIIGSIGVVGGKVGVGNALARFGVHVETFTGRPGDQGAAYRATYESPLTGWDDATKERVRASMIGVYDLFLDRIRIGRSTEGRTFTVEQIAPSAEGRIFSGTEAKRRGLVDEIGGLSAAIEKARSMAKLPETADVRVIENRPGVFEAIDPEPSDAEESFGARMRSAAGLDAQRSIVDSLPEELTQLGASALPMLRGESVLLVMPYALMVR